MLENGAKHVQGALISQLMKFSHVTMARNLSCVMFGDEVCHVLPT